MFSSSAPSSTSQPRDRCTARCQFQRSCATTDGRSTACCRKLEEPRLGGATGEAAPQGVPQGGGTRGRHGVGWLMSTRDNYMTTQSKCNKRHRSHTPVIVRFLRANCTTNITHYDQQHNLRQHTYIRISHLFTHFWRHGRLVVPPERPRLGQLVRVLPHADGKASGEGGSQRGRLRHLGPQDLLKVREGK